MTARRGQGGEHKAGLSGAREEAPPSMLLAQHSSWTMAALGIPGMKEAGSFPEPAPSTPIRLCPFPRWKAGALYIVARWGGQLASMSTAPAPPFTNTNPQRPAPSSPWTLGESCSLNCKIRSLDSVVAKLPTDLKDQNIVTKTCTGFAQSQVARVQILGCPLPWEHKPLGCPLLSLQSMFVDTAPLPPNGKANSSKSMNPDPCVTAQNTSQISNPRPPHALCGF